MAKSLGSLKVFWLLPAKTLADGLRLVCTDSDTNVMASVVDRVKNLVIYFDHEDSLVTMEWDDVIANPAADLPKVISPKKVNHIPKKDVRSFQICTPIWNPATTKVAAKRHRGLKMKIVTVAALIVMWTMRTFLTVTMNGVMVMMTCLQILLMQMLMIRGLPKGERRLKVAD